MLNLQNAFLKAMGACALAIAFFCIIKRPLASVPKPLGTALCAFRELCTYALLQLGLNLVYMTGYVLYVKNGEDVAFSDLGVAFIAVAVAVFYLAWRLGALSRSGFTLLPAALYSGFLLCKFFSVGKGLGIFGYIMVNPVFGFIGDGGWRAVSALLPFACAALGWGLAVKNIDKSSFLCNNRSRGDKIGGFL